LLNYAIHPLAHILTLCKPRLTAVPIELAVKVIETAVEWFGADAPGDLLPESAASIGSD